MSNAAKSLWNWRESESVGFYGGPWGTTGDVWKYWGKWENIGGLLVGQREGKLGKRKDGRWHL